MNRARLLRLRADEEVGGLDRVWHLLSASGADLTPPQLTSLRDKYDQHRRELVDLERHAGRKNWSDLAEIVIGTAEFEREIFCYAVGRLLRAQPLDQDVGAAADRLLAELAHRTGIADPPITGLELELGWETLAPLIELVRLRFPGAGIWDLPILAHEFGHYVLGNPPAVDAGNVRKLGDVRARLVQELEYAPAMGRCMGTEADDRQCRQRRVEELMADVFATYTIGPAYAQCCIALRVPPTELDLLDDRHPPWRLRVRAMIETLHSMSDRSTGDHFLGVVADDVQALWQVVSGDSGSVPDEDGVSCLQQWVHDITGVLNNIRGLMYSDGRRAGKIVDLLDEAEGGSLPAGSTVTHVLNAAWKWRLDRDHMSSDELGLAGARFLEYCMRV